MTRRKGEDPGKATTDNEYLTTAEVARLLRLNQKKVYALLQQRRLPAARVSGKWLFPRTLVARWVAEHTVYPPTGVMGALLDKLLVLQGSDDWLLGTAIDALRARDGASIATALVGSLGGLRSLAEGGAHAAGFHLDDDAAHKFVPPGDTWYLVSLAEREQGLIFPRAMRSRIRTPADAGRLRLRLADRQPDSGTYHLARKIFAEAGSSASKLKSIGPFASHIEAALAVRANLADVAVGVRVAAEMCGLDFLPLHSETFRLAVPGLYFGHTRVAGFLKGLLSEFEAAKRRGTPGYSFESLGRIRPLERSIDERPGPKPGRRVRI